MKTVIAFIIALVVGAAITLVVRSALHDPHAGHTTPTAATPASAPLPAAAPSAVAVPDPHAGHAPATPVKTGEDPHAGHAPSAVTAPAPKATTPETATPETTGPDATTPAPLTVNSICPICGMDVDPSLGIWHYQGKPIGIGCRACVNKIENEIDRYGPAALDNKRLR